MVAQRARNSSRKPYIKSQHNHQCAKKERRQSKRPVNRCAESCDIRFALETNDPLLAELVRRADAGEPLLDEAGYLKPNWRLKSLATAVGVTGPTFTEQASSRVGFARARRRVSHALLRRWDLQSARGW